MKKNTIIWTISLLLVFIFVSAICFSAISQAGAQDTQRTCVVLDAGHGGIDAGVRGKKTKTKESDINLSIVRKVAVCLEDAGIKVVLTRKTEAGLYGVSSKGFKKRDMLARKKIIEEAAPAAMVSIHQNFFSLSSKRGAQVFFREDSKSGYALACAIQDCMNNMPQAVRKNTPLKGDYYMVNCTEYASVICECGFLSNSEDEALLVTEEYQQKIAYAVFSGIVAYLSSKNINS